MDPITLLLLSMGLLSAGSGALNFFGAREAEDAAELGTDDIFFSLPRTALDVGSLGAVGQDILAGLGRTDPQLARTQDPVAQARAEIQANPALSAKQKRRALAGLDFEVQTGTTFPDPDVALPLSIALSQTSFGDIGALRTAVSQFDSEQQRVNDTFNQGFLDTVLGSRVDNELGIANLLSNVQATTPDAIEAETARNRDILFQLIDRSVQEQEQAILESANVSGINPAGAIGELREAAQFQRQSADIDALTRGLQIIQGTQQAQQTELATRLAGREGPQQSGLALSQLITNSLANQGNAASAQASNLTNLQQQSNLAQGQARQQQFQALAQPLQDIAGLVFLGQQFNNRRPGAVPSVPSSGISNVDLRTGRPVG